MFNKQWSQISNYEKKTVIYKNSSMIYDYGRNAVIMLQKTLLKE